MAETIRERIEAVWANIGEHGWSQYNNLLHALLSDGSLVPADEVQPRIDAAVAEAVEGERSRIEMALRELYERLRYKQEAAVQSGQPNEADKLNERMRGIAEATAAIRQPTQEAPARETEP